MNNNKIILYAEDDAVQNMFLTASLSKYFKIIPVKNTEEAIEILEDSEKPIALVLTDYNMKPGRNGLYLAKYAKENLGIPVILLTGVKKYACEDENYEFCDMCIEKSTDIYNIIKAIEDLISS